MQGAIRRARAFGGRGPKDIRQQQTGACSCDSFRCPRSSSQGPEAASGAIAHAEQLLQGVAA